MTWPDARKGEWVVGGRGGQLWVVSPLGGANRRAQFGFGEVPDGILGEARRRLSQSLVESAEQWDS